MSFCPQSLVEVFKALADSNRLKILLFIQQPTAAGTGKFSCRDDTCLKDLAKHLNITLPTISHHIKELVRAKLIITQKEGKCLYCKINSARFKQTGAFLENFFNS